MLGANVESISKLKPAGLNALMKTQRLTEDKKSNSYVYENQLDAAKEIVLNFFNRENRWCVLLAEMQSGKSGTFFSLPYIIGRNESISQRLKIDMHGDKINAFLLTAMNEKELISQFEKDIERYTGMDLGNNVLHLSDMKKYLDRSKWTDHNRMVYERIRKNCLIMIDESHHGSNIDSILDKFLTEIVGIDASGSASFLRENNIYVVSISATPMAEICSGYEKHKVILKNSKGYYGIREMFGSGKIKRAYDLKDENQAIRFADSICNIGKDGYIIVRVPSKNVESLQKILENRNISCFINDAKNKDQINDLLSVSPNGKIAIILHQKLRAGKRLETKHVIMVHDTASSSTDTTVQSLLGRCCGYEKNEDIEIYCDMESAKDYESWVSSGFSMGNIPAKSKNISGANSMQVVRLMDPIESTCDIGKFTNPANGRISRAKRGQQYSRNSELLKSLGIEEVDRVFRTEDPIISIINVDRNSDSNWGSHKWLRDQDMNSSSIFSGYKGKDGQGISEEDEGRIVLSAAYDYERKKMLVMVGKIAKTNVTSNEKSMYREKETEVNI